VVRKDERKLVHRGAEDKKVKEVSYDRRTNQRRKRKIMKTTEGCKRVRNVPDG
jgi:hypothetical protein